jgi:uncharacterized protein
MFARDVMSEAYGLAEWAAIDHGAALTVTGQYGDGKDYIGVADASNVVLADRYRTASLLTLDQRHGHEPGIEPPRDPSSAARFR